MAERKHFFDVFPGFDSCPGDLKELFDKVYVLEAVLVRSEKTLKIHMDSKILIAKKDIYAIEDLLTEFVFPQRNMKVKLIEHYDLSEQYNISKLTDIYKESLLLSCRQNLQYFTD